MLPRYDPELGLIYIGTSVTSPAPKFLRGSNDNQYLYHNSMLALNIDTGEIVWYRQPLVDHCELNHSFERLLIDTALAPDSGEVSWINPNIQSGEVRLVVTGTPAKIGVIYPLDREAGELLWTRPTVTQTVSDSIDGNTGTARVNPEMLFTEPGQTRSVRPNTSGGKGFPAGAYSHPTRAECCPLENTCMKTTSRESEPSFDFLDGPPGMRQRSLYRIENEPIIAPGTDNVGTLHEISVETGETLWTYEQHAGMTSLVATGGGLAFGGDSNGRFPAFDQSTGKILWELNLGSQITGCPITYAVDGKQYVAVSRGRSFVTRGLNRLTGDRAPSEANNMFVFTLPN